MLFGIHGDNTAPFFRRVTHEGLCAFEDGGDDAIGRCGRAATIKVIDGVFELTVGETFQSDEVFVFVTFPQREFIATQDVEESDCFGAPFDLNVGERFEHGFVVGIE